MTPIHKEIDFRDLRHPDAPADCEACNATKTVLLVNAVVLVVLVIFYLLMAVPAHAFVGEGAIGAVISAMQPTSSAPDNTSHGDDDNDD